MMVEASYQLIHAPEYQRPGGSEALDLPLSQHGAGGTAIESCNWE